MLGVHRYVQLVVKAEQVKYSVEFMGIIWMNSGIVFSNDDY